jgi:hypothetical protein
VTGAEYAGGHRIRLTFDDGLRGVVDFRPWLDGPGPIFLPLKKVEYFRKFRLEGCTLAWPDGEDIAPETLYEEAKKSAAA